MRSVKSSNWCMDCYDYCFFPFSSCISLLFNKSKSFGVCGSHKIYRNVDMFLGWSSLGNSPISPWAINRSNQQLYVGLRAFWTGDNTHFDYNGNSTLRRLLRGVLLIRTGLLGGDKHLYKNQSDWDTLGLDTYSVKKSLLPNWWLKVKVPLMMILLTSLGTLAYVREMNPE